MTTTQRPRTSGSPGSPPGPNPMRGGLILIAVGVVLAVILLVKAGGVGFDSTGKDVTINAGEEKVTTTTVAPTTTVAEQAPQSVQVVAANGSGKKGVASKVAQVLAQSGYTQVVATNSTQPVTVSSVLYGPGFDANARSVAKALGLPDTAVQALGAGAAVAKDQPPTAGVVILIGPELATSLEATPPTADGSTTTVAGSTGKTATTVTGSTGKTATTVTGSTGKTATTVAGSTGKTATTTTKP